MPTQPFLPNEANAFDDIQASPESEDFEYLLFGHQRTGVLSGFVVTESSPTAQTVDVTAGEGLETGQLITGSASLDLAVSSADGSNPRKDLISINPSGVAVVTAGTPAAVPAAPAVPANSIPVAILLVPISDNDHEDAQISDKRVLFDAIHAKEENASFTLDVADRIVNVTSTSGVRTVTLPDNAVFSGKEYIIKREGTNVVTITRAGSDTINGAVSIFLGSDGDVLHIISIGDGEWKII